MLLALRAAKREASLNDDEIFSVGAPAGRSARGGLMPLAPCLASDGIRHGRQAGLLTYRASTSGSCRQMVRDERYAV